MIQQPILTVKDASIQYRRADRSIVKAVNGVSFDLQPGEILGVVGESGCGKSTLAKGIMGLVPLHSGTVAFDGTNVEALQRRRRPQELLPLQMIFQDSAAAINPRRTIGAQISDAITLRTKSRPETAGNELAEIAETLERVGLPASAAMKYSHEFSGGQRQRIALARALAAKPKVIVADEPISALDASAQAYAANLIVEICREENISLVFVSHDLSVVRAIADRVMIMYLGRVFEIGPTEQVWDDPAHPYARSLIRAIPVPDGTGTRPLALAGEVPDPTNAPSGCVFHPRCPERFEACDSVVPRLLDVSEGRKAACLLLEQDVSQRSAGEATLSP